MIVQSAIRDRESGVVHVGHRHPDVIRQMVELGYPTPIRGEQGFIDEHGVFYNRIAAATHAIEHNQIKELRWPPLLYSEDLY